MTVSLRARCLSSRLPSGSAPAVVAICCAALFMTTLDNTILNIAIPALQREMKGSPGALQWTIDCYVLARSALLFLGGWLSDRVGRRRCLRLGLVVFTACSMACAAGHTFPQLIVARAAQAAGGALMTPAGMGIIVNTFRDRARRAQAVGMWSATTGISTAAGPVVGGVLVQSFGWRSVFLVNVPVGVLALGATIMLPESRNHADDNRRFDFLGQVAIMTALGTLVYALITAPETGWGSPRILAVVAISVAAWAAFVVTELHVRHPMLRLNYFSHRELTGAVLVAVVAFLGLGGFTFLTTIYLQSVRGLSALQAGLAMLPATATTLVCAPLSGRITGRRGPRLPATTACGLMAVSFLALSAVLRPSAPLMLLMLMFSIFGVGIGLVNPPVTNAAVSSIPSHAAGVAAATTSTARQVGTSIGVALLGSIVFSIASPFTSQHSRHTAVEASFTHGLRDAFALAGMMAVGGALVALWAFRRRCGTVLDQVPED